MKLLNRKQLEIIKLSSKDETRQALNSLYIYEDTTVTTDGHRMIAVKSNQFNREDWPPNGVNWQDDAASGAVSFLVDRKTIEDTLKNIPKNPAMPILASAAVGLIEAKDGEPDRVVCQTTDLDRTKNIEARTITGKFPNYKQVIPDYKNEELYISMGINASYLEEVCNLLKKYREKSCAITLYMKKEDANRHSLVITAYDGEGTEATAIIMPYRI